MNNYLKRVCKKKNLLVSESYNEKFKSDIITIMSDKPSKNNILNISISDSNKIEAFIIDEEKNIIEKFERTFESVDEENQILDDTVNTFDVLNSLDNSEYEILNEEDEDISNEEDVVSYETIPEGLNDLKLKTKWIGDRMKELSDSSDDIEEISILLDLVNNIYSLYIDIASAYETFIEKETEDEELEAIDYEDDIEDELNESVSKINIAKSVLEARKLNSMGVISDAKLSNFENACKDIFNDKTE